MKKLLFSLSLILSGIAGTAQVVNPLYVYSLEKIYPYNLAEYDSIAVLDDTAQGANLLMWGRYGFYNSAYVSSGHAYDGYDEVDFYSTTGQNSYSIYEVLTNSTDTLRSVLFFKDENARDTASAVYEYEGHPSPVLIAYRQYFYNPAGYHDSLYSESYLNGQTLVKASTKFYAATAGMLDSSITTDVVNNYSDKSFVVRDSLGVIQYQDYYQDIGNGYDYFGRDIFIRNSQGKITEIEEYIYLQSYLLYEVIRFRKSRFFDLPETGTLKASIYPNPTDDYLKVSTAGENLKYQLYSMDGCELKSDELHSNLIDLSRLPAGEYILKLHSAGETDSFTFKKL